jgi:hypothetical protein
MTVAVYVAEPPTVGLLADETTEVVVPALPTTTFTVLLLPTTPLPEKVALIRCEPTLKGAVVSVATSLPLTIARLPLPRLVPVVVSLKATVPVLVVSVPPVPVMVACKVTGRPKTGEAVKLTTDVEVVKFDTLCVNVVSAAVKLAAKFGRLPLYTAMMMCAPRVVNLALLIDALPLTTPVLVPSVKPVVVSLKVTVPLLIGAALGMLAVTVAVKVTNPPGSEGFGDEESEVLVLAAPTVKPVSVPLVFVKPVPAPE